jgi:hypothetical protein
MGAWGARQDLRLIFFIDLNRSTAVAEVNG